MSKKTVTILDVARHLGVNASTVSRALNPKTKYMVKPNTVQRVEEAAKAMNYQPNRMAYALKMKQSRTIGIIIPDLMNPVFPPIIRGIEGPLEEAGYTAIIANTDNDDKRKREVFESLRSQFADGFILAATSLEDPVVDACIEHEIPVVSINRTVKGGTINAVINDEAHGIRLAVDHLVDLGHRRIAHVAGPKTLSTGESRYQAFLDSLRAHGMEPDAGLIVDTHAFNEEEGYRAFRELLDRRSDFTAVVAGNDLIALGCLDALEETKLRCPEDISITGYNNFPMIDRVSPPLTTVAVPLYEMGEQAARSLLEIIENPDQPVKNIQLRPELMIRQSTAPPNPDRESV